MIPRTSSPQDLIRAGRPFSRIQGVLVQTNSRLFLREPCTPNIYTSPRALSGTTSKVLRQKMILPDLKLKKSTLQIPGFAGEAGTPTHPASYVTDTNFALQSPPIKGEGIESMLCKMCFPGSKLSPQSIKSTLCNLLTVVALSVHKYVSISTTASRDCVFSPACLRGWR